MDASVEFIWIRFDDGYFGSSIRGRTGMLMAATGSSDDVIHRRVFSGILLSWVPYNSGMKPHAQGARPGPTGATSLDHCVRMS